MISSEDAIALGQAALSNSINQIVLAPKGPQLLVLHGDGELSASDDGGASWRPWQAPELAGEAVAAVLAPQGFEAGQAVWAGSASGRVVRARV